MIFCASQRCVAVTVVVGSSEDENDVGVDIHFMDPAAEIPVIFRFHRGDALAGDAGAADAVVVCLGKTAGAAEGLHEAFIITGGAAAFRDAVPQKTDSFSV